MFKMAEALSKKLDENFGGSWVVFFLKGTDCVWFGEPWNGTYIMSITELIDMLF